MGDKKTVLTITRSDGRRLSMLNLIEAMTLAATTLAAKTEQEMNQDHAQFMLVSDDGTLLVAIPFSSHDRNQGEMKL